jgi:hypothetical protein
MGTRGKVYAAGMPAMVLCAAAIAGCGGALKSATTPTTNATTPGTGNGNSHATGGPTTGSATAGSGAGVRTSGNDGLFAPHVNGVLDCSSCFANSNLATSLIPAGALAANEIQNLSGWFDATDASGGGGGTASGTMQVVGAPSLSGSAREFTTTFTNSGDERYAVTFEADTESTHFFYDAWVYVASPSNDVANIEMDMNQVLANGQTVIYGFQCDGYSGTWDYTENSGTPSAPVDAWVHSTEACNPREWATDVWHHVQISYDRDDAGNVTYNSVWLDGSEQALNVTVPSAFALGWGSTLLTNFQVDGLGSDGSSTVYLDELTVSRW